MTTGQQAAGGKRSASAPVPSQRVKQLPGFADIMKAPMVRAAIEELVAAGMNQHRLELAVQSVVFFQIMPAVRVQDVRGFTRKSITLFPGELRRTATRIEMVSGSLFYGMVANLFMPGSHWEETCKNLRAYADLWDVLIPAFRQTSKDNPREYDLRLFAKRRLIAEVAEATGKPRYNRLAELLTAAYDAVDLPLREEASALRHLWEIHVKKMAKRRYRRMALKMVGF
jgi:hypothetical protein